MSQRGYRFIHSTAGQQTSLASRSFGHKTFQVSDTPVLLGNLLKRNFLLIYHWPNIDPGSAGAILFIGDNEVENAGADDMTITDKTGMPVYEGLYPSLHIPEGKVYAVTRPGVTKIVSIIESF